MVEFSRLTTNIEICESHRYFGAGRQGVERDEFGVQPVKIKTDA